MEDLIREAKGLQICSRIGNRVDVQHDPYGCSEPSVSVRMCPAPKEQSCSSQNPYGQNLQRSNKTSSGSAGKSSPCTCTPAAGVFAEPGYQCCCLSPSSRSVQAHLITCEPQHSSAAPCSLCKRQVPVLRHQADVPATACEAPLSWDAIETLLLHMCM